MMEERLSAISGAIQQSQQHIADQVREIEEARRTALGYAEVMFEKLLNQIADFEKTLSYDEETGCYLASFGKEISIRIEAVGYDNPYFIVFHGYTLGGNERVQLVQHVSQINVLLVAVEKPKDRDKPRRLGFKSTQTE